MKSQHIGYVRVSTLDQSAERQREDMALDKVFTDYASGKDMDRPQLQAALKKHPHGRGEDCRFRGGPEGIARL